MAETLSSRDSMFLGHTLWNCLILRHEDSLAALSDIS